MTYTPTIGDLVLADTPHGARPGQITNIHHHPHVPNLYDVKLAAHGTWPATIDELHPAPTTPAPGQVWQCTTRPDLHLTVIDVERGGLIAHCRTPHGSITAVTLIGHYTPTGVAS